MFLALVGYRIAGYFMDPYAIRFYEYIFVSLASSLYLLTSDLAECCLLAFLIYISGDHASMFGITRPKLVRAALWIALAKAIIATIDYFIYGLANPEVLWNTYEEFKPSLAHRPIPFVVGLTILLLDCIAQEFVFRGYFFARFTEVTRSVPAGVLVSSMSFAAVHLHQGVSGVLGAFFFGIVCCLTVIATRSLWPAAFVHFLFNAYYSGVFG